MNTNQDRFYIDIDTQDRVKATYQIHLIRPATHDGYVEIEAFSEQEAIELALGERRYDVDWDCQDSGGEIEVFDVSCDEPPENTILFERGYNYSGASLDHLFEPDAHRPKQLLCGYSLVDSEERQRQFPDSWQHPPEGILAAIRPGDCVKIAVEGADVPGERFWTVVQEVSESAYVVRVENDLLFSQKHQIHCGDILCINRQNIIDVWPEVSVRRGAEEVRPV
jgi:hypothetical protein